MPSLSSSRKEELFRVNCFRQSENCGGGSWLSFWSSFQDLNWVWIEYIEYIIIYVMCNLWLQKASKIGSAWLYQSFGSQQNRNSGRSAASPSSSRRVSLKKQTKKMEKNEWCIRFTGSQRSGSLQMHHVSDLQPKTFSLWARTAFSGRKSSYSTHGSKWLKMARLAKRMSSTVAL